MEYRSKKMIKQNQTYIPGKMDLYSDKDPEKSYYISLQDLIPITYNYNQYEITNGLVLDLD